MIQMNLLTKQTHSLWEGAMFAGGRMGEKRQGVWNGHVHTAVFKIWTKKDLSYNTWNSTQCYVAAWIAESLCCSPETVTTLLIGCTPIQKFKLFFFKKDVRKKEKL